jgi:hypothetical protein
MRYCLLILLLTLLVQHIGVAQPVDSIPDSIHTTIRTVGSLENILDSNQLVKFQEVPQNYPVIKKQDNTSEFNFYFWITLMFMFGVLRFAYPKYVNNLFRVFFNTSLRQSQITDQLLMAKLPSLFFNILFVLSSGFYIYLLLSYTEVVKTREAPLLLGFLIIGLALMYIVKFITIRFAGWITHTNKEADNYIFIVFLVNKILGVVLLPVLPVLAFARPSLAAVGFSLSYVIIGLMLILRYFRSYESLHARLQINKFHFLIYVIGVEIIPLLLVYKATLRYIRDIS